VTAAALATPTEDPAPVSNGPPYTRSSTKPGRFLSIVSLSSKYCLLRSLESQESPPHVPGTRVRGSRLRRAALHRPTRQLKREPIRLRGHRYDGNASGRRLTQRDPIGFNGGPNHYVYAENSPGMNSDPGGLTVYQNCQLKKGSGACGVQVDQGCRAPGECDHKPGHRKFVTCMYECKNGVVMVRVRQGCGDCVTARVPRTDWGTRCPPKRATINHPGGVGPVDIDPNKDSGWGDHYGDD
jgi:hypothetical protein